LVACIWPSHAGDLISCVLSYVVDVFPFVVSFPPPPRGMIQGVPSSSAPAGNVTLGESGIALDASWAWGENS
jgi:hypothetical protein